MHVLRFANGAQEAAEIRLAYPKAVNCKDGNFFADVTGDAMVIESRNPPVIAARATWARRIFSTTPTTTWRGQTETSESRTTSPAPVG